MTYTAMGYLLNGGSIPGSGVVPAYFADFLRSNLFPMLYIRQLLTRVTIPRGYGDSVKIPNWKSPYKPGTATATLTGSGITAISSSSEFTAAVTPAGLCADSISGSVIQFRGARGYTDKVNIVTYADFIEGAMEVLSKELAGRIDTYARQKISASGNLKHVVPVSNSKCGGAHTMNGKSVAKLLPLFAAHMVPPFDDDCYVAVAHPYTQFDLFKDTSATGFVQVSQYGQPDNIYRGEIGRMYGVRFLLSPNIPILSAKGATSATYGLSGGVTGSNMYVFAPDAGYSIELEDGGVEVFHKELGSGGISDITNNLGGVGVKVWYGVAAPASTDWRLIRYAHALTIKS